MRVLLALKSEDVIDCAMALVPNSKQAAIATPLSRLKGFFMVIP
jgi:hypothetical protein